MNATVVNFEFFPNRISSILREYFLLQKDLSNLKYEFDLNKIKLMTANEAKQVKDKMLENYIENIVVIQQKIALLENENKTSASTEIENLKNKLWKIGKDSEKFYNITVKQLSEIGFNDSFFD